MSPSVNEQVVPYITYPQVIFLAYERGNLTLPQFHILLYGYFKAEWANDYRVPSYSAAAVCRFWGLIDPASTYKVRSAEDKAAVHQYIRAGNALRDCGVIVRHDFRQLDSHKDELAGRTYSIWLVPPDQFPPLQARKDSLSLYGDDTYRANGTVPAAVSDGEPSLYGEKQRATGTVPPPVMAIPNQENQNPEREIPLNPPDGGLDHPSVPPVGGRRSRWGSSKPAQENKANLADRERTANLALAATRYSNLMDTFYGFVADTDHIRILLQSYKPTELLFAQIEKFSPAAKFSTRDMAVFFRRTAKVKIDGARGEGVSIGLPECFAAGSVTGSISNLIDRWSPLIPRWQAVLDAWNTGLPADEQDAGFSHEYELEREKAEQNKRANRFLIPENITEHKLADGKTEIRFEYQCSHCSERHSSAISASKDDHRPIGITRPCGKVIVQNPYFHMGKQS